MIKFYDEENFDLIDLLFFVRSGGAIGSLLFGIAMLLVN